MEEEEVGCTSMRSSMRVSCAVVCSGGGSSSGNRREHSQR